MKKVLFKKLLKEQKNHVYSYACMMLRNQEDAEDVTQDAFIRLWQNWEAVNSKKRKAWLIRVTHNRCIDLIRNKRATIIQQRINSDMDLDKMTSHDQNRPDQRIEEKEIQENLLKAMDQLQETTKSMLLLHYYQGMTFENIGQILEMKPNTVKVAVHRGRKRLREILSNDDIINKEVLDHEQYLS